ncbi:nuclear transport factor 2 family protein [Marinomonas sp. C2222]|uniref:Nuclear transport factor 2 family protein n=1 Tax=Marinomonas sargassi TaxID=2984494 RepID=A0ABT2YVX9_9GAMM|nr:nuclear transport factor 2 family protein [Marinomonas sargassi]MCV2404057.1 nuclear transport factor 2 family protein [Marinomonas sargassi]
MNRITLRKLVAPVAIATACLTMTSTATAEQKMTNTEKAVALIESIENGNPEPVGFINPHKYIQHNLAIGDGLAGFGEAMKMLPPGGAKASVQRAFQDGDYVVLHTEYDFFGPKAGFDVFRFENDKIVEHWDNLQEIAPPNPSGHTQFDGPTQVTDLSKTDENKALVTDFVETILIKGDMGKIGQFIGPNDEDYIQHNPAVSDGLSGLGKALAALAQQGMPMAYNKNHKVLGQGDFVLSISEGKFLDKHVAFYDLFRVEDGKIVEHWDTIENIPPKADWKNDNGKFGF